MRRLHSLDAWRSAQELSHAAYRITNSEKLSKHFALVDQIRRAAISIPANIAEGYALGSTAQFLRCLKISLGSTTELFTHLSLVHALRILPDSEVVQCLELCDRVISIVIGLIRKLMRQGH
ncbi:MAG TPA: four helix bundle protein [Gemmatimonadales bacterium]